MVEGRKATYVPTAATRPGKAGGGFVTVGDMSVPAGQPRRRVQPVSWTAKGSVGSHPHGPR